MSPERSTCPFSGSSSCGHVIAVCVCVCVCVCEENTVTCVVYLSIAHKICITPGTTVQGE